MADARDELLEQWRKPAVGGVRMMDALVEAMTEANTRIARCMQEGARAAGPLPFSGELPATGFQLVDNAYREMIKSSQQFLQSATKAFTPGATAAGSDVKKAA